MRDFKLQIANCKSRLVLLAGALLVLGMVAWGVGWAAHSLFDRWATRPTERLEPTALPAVTPTPGLAIPITPSSPSPAEKPASTLLPTSTPRPTLTSSPVPRVRTYVAQPNQGLAKIAGIVCPDLVSYPDRLNFARQIQQSNPDKIQNIDDVPVGVELVIPPCP